MRHSLPAIATLCFSIISGAAFGADVVPVKVLSTIAVQGAYTEVQSLLSPGVKTEFAQTVPLVERLSKGETADVVILTHAAIEGLAAKGRVKSQADLIVSTVGIAFPDGAKTPPMKNKEDFIAFLKATPSVAYSTQGQSGMYVAKLIGQLGLEDVVKAKAVLVTEGPTAARLMKGEVVAAIQQISELKTGGAKNIIPFPDDIQLRTVFTAAVLNDTASPKESEAVLKVLTSPKAIEAYKRSGAEPAVNAK